MHFLLTTQKSLQIFKSLLIYWTPKATSFYEMSKLSPNFHVFSNEMALCKILLVYYQNACWKCKGQGCFEELECITWHWTHFRAPFILPLLDYVHALIKIAQNINVFVYDFVDFVKLAQAKVVQTLFWPLCQVWGSIFWQLSIYGSLDQWNLSYKLVLKPKWWRWWQIFHLFICQEQVLYVHSIVDGPRDL